LKRIGLTGGIGSGKTAVAQIFEKLGVPVYYADERAKKLMHMDFDLVKSIKLNFGKEIYVEGALDRVALASLVFNDPEQIKTLNNLVHPAVARDFSAWLESQEKNIPYVLKEAAILFESGSHRDLDAVILVSAPVEIRLKRVMDRDALDEASVRARMANQWPESDKIPLSDYLIVNDGEHSLIEQVMALHTDLLGEEH